MVIRLGIELEALGRVFMPDVTDSHKKIFRGVISVILVTAWSAGTLLMMVEDVPTTRPEIWTVFTAIIFLMIGRFWDIEVEKLYGG